MLVTRLENFVDFGKYTFVKGVTTTLKIALTIPAIALSILTLGQSSIINGLAIQMQYKEKLERPYFSEVFCKGIRVINPEFKLEDSYLEDSNNRIGSLTKPVMEFLGKNIDLKSDNFFVKHIFSRIGFLIGAVAFTASRIVDFAIGLFAGALSILLHAAPRFLQPEEFIRNITDIAYRNLSILNIIDDVGTCLRAALYPFPF